MRKLFLGPAPRLPTFPQYCPEWDLIHWLLWSRSYDDSECRWRDTLYAYGPKKGVIEKTAAVYLVFQDLRRGAEVSNLDRFHWIGADHGLLSTPELLAIAREVWP